MHIMQAARMWLYNDPLTFCLVFGLAALVVFLWCVHQVEKRGWFHLT